eukprot:TRINITY_DN51228_c0_g1_i1.p1 TRINITY_DN51228_c0_g1~~TRINITY_DN51228_c0_g1_i1.p1  ORF type:complete len:828 (+),score=157.20 TRINITY_DN51228_c0_g1_i1:97-2580(+)
MQPGEAAVQTPVPAVQAILAASRLSGAPPRPSRRPSLAPCCDARSDNANFYPRNNSLRRGRLSAALQAPNAKLLRMLDELRALSGVVTPHRREGEDLNLPPVPPRSRKGDRAFRRYEALTAATQRRNDETAAALHTTSYVPERILEVRGMDEDAFIEWQGMCDKRARERAARCARDRAQAAANRTPPRSPAEWRARELATAESKVRVDCDRRREVVADHQQHKHRRWRADLRREQRLSDHERRALGLQTVLVQTRATNILPAMLLLGRMQKQRDDELALFWGTKWRRQARLRAKRALERKALHCLGRNFRRAFFNMRITKKKLSVGLIARFLRNVANSNHAGRAIHHYRHCIIAVQRWWRYMEVSRACWLVLIHRQWLRHERMERARSSIDGGASPPGSPRRGSLRRGTRRESHGSLSGVPLIRMGSFSAAGAAAAADRPRSVRNSVAPTGLTDEALLGKLVGDNSRRPSALGHRPSAIDMLPNLAAMRRGSAVDGPAEAALRLRKRKERMVMQQVHFLAWDVESAKRLYIAAHPLTEKQPAALPDTKAALAFILVRWMRRRARENGMLQHQYGMEVDAYLKQKRYIQRIANFRAGSPESSGSQRTHQGKAGYSRATWARQERSQVERIKVFEESVRLGLEEPFANANGLVLPVRETGRHLMELPDIVELKKEWTALPLGPDLGPPHPRAMSPVPEQGGDAKGEADWFTPDRGKKRQRKVKHVNPGVQMTPTADGGWAEAGSATESPSGLRGSRKRGASKRKRAGTEAAGTPVAIAVPYAEEAGSPTPTGVQSPQVEEPETVGGMLLPRSPVQQAQPSTFAFPMPGK